MADFIVHFKKTFLFMLLVLALSVAEVKAQIPQMIPYTGTIAINGTAFNGEGRFKFALVDGAITLWSNDNSSVAGSEPLNYVPLPVNDGVFTVNLGNNLMDALPVNVFDTGRTFLRVWFNDGVTGFQQLSPDQHLVSVPYAYKAEVAGSVDWNNLKGIPADFADGIDNMANGVPGPQGLEGLIGLTGPAGAAGAIGATGPAGSIGLTGPSGPASTIGPVGPTGLAGPAGAAGATGTTGPAGTTGSIGLTGPAGAAGATGTAGSQGSQGPAGSSGTSSWTDRFGRVTTSLNVGIGTGFPNEQLEITHNFRLPSTTIVGSTTAGIIYSGLDTFIHSFGIGNFFAGEKAGNLTMTGVVNTAVGESALTANISGLGNAAFGYEALKANTTGHQNTALGTWALRDNIGGHNNIAVGRSALLLSTSGNENLAFGFQALVSNKTGSSNTAIGSAADVTSDNLSFATAIGALATVGCSDCMALGNSFIKVGIGMPNPLHPIHAASGAHVTDGGVWTNASSRAYKENITELSQREALATLKDLEPVSYNYKIDKAETYVGFIAEDVPSLVATEDRKGLSPMDIVAVLTKVVQSQQDEIEKLKSKVAGQEVLRAEVAAMKAQMAQLNALVSGNKALKNEMVIAENR